ncbi:MAG TPA: acetamidase [Blastocatellia bacterium]|nr:acetamidase [Blastocatellia bacterium]
MKITKILITLSALVISLNAQQPLQLKPTPKTVAWGYYDAAAPPVMRIKSGDIVEVQTLITSSPTRLEGAGVKPADVEQSLRDIYKEVTNKGPGGHILTGPIFIEGAEPGDVLEVRIKSIKLAIPYAYNAFGPRSGTIPEDFPYAKMRIIPLDAKRMVAHFADGIDIPLRPFFGSIGVAPPPAAGRINSAPPGIHAGNLDNKELVAGTTLYIPVHAPGALLLIGDGHAGQGNGEVDITAMETSLIGTFQLIVRKDMHLKWPRAETPTHYIAMGIDEDLREAAKLAVREMIDFLVTEKHLTRDDAYQLASVAADFDITQLVDGTKGVHAMIPKAIFVGQKGNDDTITLERTVCFGTCPAYRVTISSDGAVTFEGRQYTKTKGTGSGHISTADFRKLVSEFEKIDYFSLPDRYAPGTKECPRVVTDMPSADTSIRLKGKSKSVAHYYGCGNSGVLGKLTALETKIDEVTGTQKWIK